MPPKKQNFEQRIERLKTIVSALEQEDLPLQEGVALYKEGLTLATACTKELEQARHTVSVVSDGVARELETLDPEQEQ
ncbi:MAG TPA: exodeoxyribonuclease VII small subunit [Desulfomicrobiaceae bacterium]|nr:exodeoxyribonuclease VII small subunit [Desulfomicrobiaceae bacterium]